MEFHAKRMSSRHTEKSAPTGESVCESVSGSVCGSEHGSELESGCGSVRESVPESARGSACGSVSGPVFESVSGSVLESVSGSVRERVHESDASLQAPSEALCESCECWPIHVTCEDCQVSLCDKCSHGHTKLPACRHHTFTPVSTPGQHNRRSIETVLSTCQNVLLSYKERLKTFQEYVHIVDTQAGVIEAEIDRSEQELHALNTHVHAQLRKDLQRITQSETTKVKRRLTQIKQRTTILQTEEAKVSTLLQQQNIGYLLNDNFIKQLTTCLDSKTQECIHLLDEADLGPCSISFAKPSHIQGVFQEFNIYLHDLGREADPYSKTTSSSADIVRIQGEEHECGSTATEYCHCPPNAQALHVQPDTAASAATRAHESPCAARTLPAHLKPPPPPKPRTRARQDTSPAEPCTVTDSTKQHMTLVTSDARSTAPHTYAVPTISSNSNHSVLTSSKDMNDSHNDKPKLVINPQSYAVQSLDHSTDHPYHVQQSNVVNVSMSGDKERVAESDVAAPPKRPITKPKPYLPPKPRTSDSLSEADLLTNVGRKQTGHVSKMVQISSDKVRMKHMNDVLLNEQNQTQNLDARASNFQINNNDNKHRDILQKSSKRLNTRKDRYYVNLPSKTEGGHSTHIHKSRSFSGTEPSTTNDFNIQPLEPEHSENDCQSVVPNNMKNTRNNSISMIESERIETIQINAKRASLPVIGLERQSSLSTFLPSSHRRASSLKHQHERGLDNDSNFDILPNKTIFTSKNNSPKSSPEANNFGIGRQQGGRRYLMHQRRTKSLMAKIPSPPVVPSKLRSAMQVPNSRDAADTECHSAQDSGSHVVGGENGEGIAGADIVQPPTDFSDHDDTSSLTSHTSSASAHSILTGASQSLSASTNPPPHSYTSSASAHSSLDTDTGNQPSAVPPTATHSSSDLDDTTSNIDVTSELCNNETEYLNEEERASKNSLLKSAPSLSMSVSSPPHINNGKEHYELYSLTNEHNDAYSWHETDAMPVTMSEDSENTPSTEFQDYDDFSSDEFDDSNDENDNLNSRPLPPPPAFKPPPIPQQASQESVKPVDLPAQTEEALEPIETALSFSYRAKQASEVAGAEKTVAAREAGKNTAPPMPLLLKARRKRYRRTHLCRYTDSPCRLLRVRGQLWTVMRGGDIHVLTYKGILQKKIDVHVSLHTEDGGTGQAQCVEFEAKSLSVTPDSGILVACEGLRTDDLQHPGIHEGYSDMGLFLIDTDGSVLDTVATGRFWDVTCDSNYVFALSAKSANKPQIVSIYDAQQPGNYQLLRHVTLQDCEYERILVYNIDTVYASSIVANEVHRYCFQTMKMAELTCDDKSGGPLDGPLLCAVDEAGSVLVSNRAQHRLHVLDAGGACTSFPLSGVSDPYDALLTVHSNKTSMFVISEHDDSLYRFTQSFI